MLYNGNNLPLIIELPPLEIKADDFAWKPYILNIWQMIPNLLKHLSSRQRETVCLPFLLPTVPFLVFLIWVFLLLFKITVIIVW